MIQIEVNIRNSPYTIFIADRLKSEIGPLIRDRLSHQGDVAVVTNPTVGALYAEPVLESLKSAGYAAALAEVPDGEQHKRLDTVAALYNRFLEAGLDRKGLVVALGGGVVGDMAGFAAATYLRGVPFVQMPTTLLAMVDASVGGKTGVDLDAGKNLVGAFYQPRMVVIDPTVLSTLPSDELACGMAEVVKHGLIGNPELFELLEKSPPTDFAALVNDAVRVKVDVVERDPLEQGERALLNLGHTFGHAFELLSDYTLKHGAAVGLGLVAATKMAAILGECDASLVERVERVLAVQNLKTRIAGYDVDQVALAMKHDKKRSKKRIRFVIPNRPGRCRILEEASEELIRASVAWVVENGE
jgi:3-dehydroquinate synthase